LLISLNELEKLKPLVQQKINELNSRNAHQQNGRGNFLSNNSVDFSPAKKQILPGNSQIKVKFAGKISFEGCSSPVIFFLVTLPYIYFTRQSEQLPRSLFTKDQVANSSLMSDLWKSKCEDCKYSTRISSIIGPPL